MVNDEELYTSELLDKVHNTELSILKDFIKVANKYNLRWFAIYGTALGAIRHKGFIPWDDDVDVALLREDYEKFENIFQEELSKKYNLVNPLRTNGFSASVTHLELKGTKFISRDSINMSHRNGICIDIFVFDKVSTNNLKKKIQYKKAWFYGRLIFLCENASPHIPLKGIAKHIAVLICKIINKFLELFKVSPKTIYKKLIKISTKYNNTDSNLFTTLEDPDMIANTIEYENIFPLKQVPYENLSVNVMNNYDKNLTNIYGDYMAMPPKEKRYNHRPAIIEF